MLNLNDQCIEIQSTAREIDGIALCNDRCRDFLEQFTYIWCEFTCSYISLCAVSFTGSTTIEHSVA